jgi:hypothetical protein
MDGFPVNHILSRNGVPLTPEEYQQHEDDLKKMAAARQAQTPEQRAKLAAARRKRGATRRTGSRRLRKP